MSVLDHLKEYRVVKAVLTLQDDRQQVLDGVAKVTSPPLFEVTFLPDQLDPSLLNKEEFSHISFDVAGENKILKARIDSSPEPAKLLLEMVDSFTHQQKRNYFRVDAELSVSYWKVDEENSSAKPVQMPVNISGGGMRLPVAEKIANGSELGLEIIIDEPQAAIIECVGQVVGNYDVGGEHQIALKFTDIEEEAQDAIVAYCLAEQRKQLRLRVKVLGNSEE